ncbi:methylmalonyl-CoA mutase family protein [bacterium]|nr:methylmalonyl-CoA mutase family protein [bacterium]
METEIYKPKNKIRFVTAASLFDGHDASINVMRRILQASGVEVIHLGHNRSAEDVVNTAIQEDAQAIAVSSYQGGHIEYFKYMRDLLKQKGAGHIKIFGGGGGVIVPEEIKELESYGIDKIYSPEDGRHLGLQGMINDMLQRTDFPTIDHLNGQVEALNKKDPRVIAQLITYAESLVEESTNGTLDALRKKLDTIKPSKIIPVLGITGTGGAGKSSLTDELVRRFINDFQDKNVAIISVDPSKRKTGGALLGDRIRMNSIVNPRVYMRSLATRQSNLALSKAIEEAIEIVRAAAFDLIIVETAGIGQSDSEIVDLVDVSMYVMTSDFGAATQLEKIDMIDFADVVVLNKFDKRGSLDALRDVRKQYKRSRKLFEAADETLPIFGTIASQFNDPGVNILYAHLIRLINERVKVNWSSSMKLTDEMSKKKYIIPPERTRYLSEITDTVRGYHRFAGEQSEVARKIYQLKGAKDVFSSQDSLASGQLKSFEIGADEGESTSKISFDKVSNSDDVIRSLDRMIDNLNIRLRPEFKKRLEAWDEFKKLYAQDKMVTKVRDKEIVNELSIQSLSGTRIPKVALPQYKDWGDLLRWIMKENVPGEFPYTAGVFPFKRTSEDPTRMFAGEGTPERTNKRFHYLSKDQPYARLSTAFDSVTLYGEDPDYRPDIYGKIGNSGVSICTLDDMKKLYAGFDLCDPNTSVSMTINGPAPMILAMFFNTAIDQQVEKYLRENGQANKLNKPKVDHAHPHYAKAIKYDGVMFGYGTLGTTGDKLVDRETYEKIKAYTLSVVRGTVQADILKEDQAQNTCIFSTEFALKMMGDMQEYYVKNKIRNHYSVSISGYHIAEAGANPITQTAFTLANGFTYLEYYLSRGMNVDDFAPNLSFFFSNGLDPEYSVIGRVARRIWSIALKYKYKGNDRSQKLKYHIQTSGRSLHAMEISFNDIRTTLQALMAIYDNCNSLHTNAYDEAITTPTEESVRRAMAIQLIINKELGLAKNENTLQGSFIIEELTDLVEEAILSEFDRISERGGVLGAMETMYQRNKIQEESLLYENLKHSGQLPIVGVNTFLNPTGGSDAKPTELIRSTKDEKEAQIHQLHAFWKLHGQDAPGKQKALCDVALQNGNIFGELMESVKSCSLGQISSALYQVGGQYRRNM